MIVDLRTLAVTAGYSLFDGASLDARFAELASTPEWPLRILAMPTTATSSSGWARRRDTWPGAAFALCLKQTVHLHHWTFASSTCAWPR